MITFSPDEVRSALIDALVATGLADNTQAEDLDGLTVFLTPRLNAELALKQRR